MKYAHTKFGFTVTDLDFTSTNEVQTVLEMIGNGRFVVIKNQNHVQPGVLVSFYKTLGNVVKQDTEVISDCVEGYGELLKAGKDKMFSGDDDGELEWHCAGMNRIGGEDIVAMYMRKAAVDGGVTHYSDAQTAYQDLDDETKETIKDLKCKYVTYMSSKDLDDTYFKNIFSDKESMLNFIDIDGKKSFETQVRFKQLVTQHPINGKLGLYFPWSAIRGFANMTRVESKDLYMSLKSHTLNDKYDYQHKWDDYDIILSDQLHSLHKRNKYSGKDRELWRTGIWIK